VPGKKYRSIRWPKVYEALKRKGMSKSSAAAISNAMARRRGSGGRKRRR
jgi:hypothetical protein